ncbi:PREDICTED: RNA-binding protein 39 isoform X1 [Drosophila arizonae]|uniref:RNA-binding protein 39 isoform X1 n=1 Tax=Drosophila arizonae TaxID=7263 RepID=A0ABM1NQX4_DROAR|nr:PREDICTED: RNA-binding protein 39 isoform X1 [Drosophila arizonae]XP_017857360.1 PREDICTED: RNA-binding protein 39 isoform X1 [Drosophila arizonae]
MAEDFDVEAMLEAPYQKNNVSAGSAGRGHGRSSGSESGGHDDNEEDERYAENGTRSSNGNKKRSHRSRSRSGSRHRRSKDREREKERGRERSSYREKDRDRERERDQRDHRYRDGKRSSRTRDERPSDDRRGGRNDRDRDRDRDRRSRERRGGSKSMQRDSERKRSRSRDKRRRSRSRDLQRKRMSPIRERRRSHSRSRDTNSRRRTSYSPRPYGGRGRGGGRSPPNGIGDRTPPTELSPEERDARTVFCIQLSQRVRARDLEEFFSSVGKVRDVRLITCNKTKRFKGIAYIEFEDPESVALALGLSGQRLLGVPIMVQHTQAEKNRLQSAPPPFQPKAHTGPMRLYVGSLHFNITEDMLRGIFEPFGKIDAIQLIMDTETGRSKGYGFITYHNADDAKKALEQLNGFELAGRPMKVGNVTERLDMNTSSLDTDEMDRSGIDLGATGRLQLMFKLAEGAGLAVPQAAANALLATAPQPAPVLQQQQTPSIATQCFILSNMFDPRTETNPTWATDVRDDVLDECAKHGGVLHIHVDTVSPTGTVYVKCPSTTTAVLAVNALHGRWFAGRVITAAYVPVINYHSMFPDAISAVDLIASTRKNADD